jgi:hypothetical protein
MSGIPPFENVDFLPLHGGLTNRVAHQLGLLTPNSRRLTRAIVLILIAWIPLLILSMVSGHTTGETVEITLLEDPEVNFRFLLALPLLDLAEVFLLMSLAIQVRHFLSAQIIPDSQKERFEAARRVVRRCHDAPIAELILLLIALASSLLLRLVALPDITSSWERQAGHVTWAGWWHMLVSLPILYFFLLRALWTFTLWGWFLFRMSRLELPLTPTHPDRAGGLGFLGFGLASFAPTVVSLSIIVSAGFAYEIYHRGESLDSLKYHLGVYVILVTFAVHLPVMPFAIAITRCRFRGLLDFGNLVLRHDREFDEKWIEQSPSARQGQLLGTSDVQSLADMGMAYAEINEMGFMPFDTKSAMLLALSAAIPLLPLVGTSIPLREIVSRLAEFLV